MNTTCTVSLTSANEASPDLRFEREYRLRGIAQEAPHCFAQVCAKVLRRYSRPKSLNVIAVLVLLATPVLALAVLKSGVDVPSNMQWENRSEAKAKDHVE